MIQGLVPAAFHQLETISLNQTYSVHKMNRSSRSQMFLKKGFPKSFANFTRQHIRPVETGRLVAAQFIDILIFITL